MTKMKKIGRVVAIGALWSIPFIVLAQPQVFGPEVETLKTTFGTRDVRETIAQIINVALSLLGIVAVVIILIGGFTWMTAGGNEEKTEKARKMIFAGIIGLAIILSAYAIARFVINSLLSATGRGEI